MKVQGIDILQNRYGANIRIRRERDNEQCYGWKQNSSIESFNDIQVIGKVNGNPTWYRVARFSTDTRPHGQAVNVDDLQSIRVYPNNIEPLAPLAA